MTEEKKAPERLHFLDGLRGYGILITVIYHSGGSNVGRFLDGLKLHFVTVIFDFFFTSGPGLFFLLSGMLITRPYVRMKKKFVAKPYIKSRFRRLYPTYFWALVFGALVVWFNNHYTTWYNIKGMQMWFTWKETFKEAFVINSDGLYYNLAWWSLGIEIVFYAIVPLMVAFCPSRERLTGAKVVFIILGTLTFTFVASVLCTWYAPRIYSLVDIVLGVGRFFDFALCFVVGMLLSARDFNVRQAYAFIAGGVVLLIASVIRLPVLNLAFYPFHESGYALVYSGIIILAFHIKSVTRFWDRPILIWFGERSYSLYLVHYSVFYLIDNIVSHFTPDRNFYYAFFTRLLSIPLALLTAMLLFHLVERRYAKGLLSGDMFWPWKIGALKNLAHNH